MAQTIQTEDLNPAPASRFKVEAAMFELIERLLRQGLSRAEIAVSLADAAEDYVLRLAGELELEEKKTAQHRH
jgi:hypothetical protein